MDEEEGQEAGPFIENGRGGGARVLPGARSRVHRKLYQIARRDHPERRDLTAARARAALRTDGPAGAGVKPRSLGKSAAEGPNDRLQADLVDFSQNTRDRR